MIIFEDREDFLLVTYVFEAIHSLETLDIKRITKLYQ